MEEERERETDVQKDGKRKRVIPCRHKCYRPYVHVCRKHVHQFSTPHLYIVSFALLP